MTKILVIEDTSEILNNILDFLEAEDFEGSGATNGREGVELAKSEGFDLIICDIMMPELDGYGVLQALRADANTVNIPLIFLTAKGDRSDVRQGMNLGADDYLTKPFTKKELLEAIEARLKRTEQQTEQLKQVSEQLTLLEKFDALTGLPNWSGLEGKEGLLPEAIAQSQSRNTLVPFLLLGLDKFGRINDTISYGNGDLILQQVARRLIDFTERLQGGGAVRIGGDEFGIVLPPVTEKETAVAIAQQLLQEIAQPYQIERKSIPLTASIGIAFYPTVSNVEELRRQAGVAMGEVKQSGGNSSKIYTRPLFGFDTAKELELASDLRRSWEQKQLQVFYQPRIDLRKKKISSVAAVPYWDHPRLGPIPPAKVLSLAQEVGLVREMSQWMLQIACQQGKIWQNEAKLSVRISASISEQLLNDVNLTALLMESLKSTGLDPGYLELEIPAEAIANAKNLNALASQFLQFKRLGLHLTIAQFGMAQSSLNYLGNLGLDSLKISRSLIGNPTQNAPILNAIIQMAHGINLRAIADGVESEAQVNLLKKQKCDEIQQETAVSEREIRRLFGKR
ncbi:EAL domain-containing response regulator [Laspinema olomoucense]|uniref:EAL domain-containing response regulator n=1 Tax=Laspinema olomoucense TaxID=3231600 RepID=UPI0021BB6B34|nr:EAL domain-containing protein [Laspinema sp. D3a]MCT7987393.1 EAL domain-containing protein [Laspinema sp. D3a]